MCALCSTVLRVDALCCGSEARLIRQLLSPLPDVADVKISLSERRVSVDHARSLAPEAIVELLNRKHLGAAVHERGVGGSVGSSFNHAEVARLTASAAQLGLLGAAVALRWLGFGQVACMMGWASVAMSFALFHAAYLALRRHSASVELVMAMSVLGALAQGDVAEAATVSALVSLMDLVKLFALEVVGRRLRGSVATEPQSVEAPGGGKLPLSELVVGDVYVLRVGDVVPADGRVVAGSAAVDESRVTGEATPQAKGSGERVHSGATVSSGYVHVRAEAPVSASFQARVASAVEEAKGTLSEVEELVGKFAAWYTPLVLCLALALGVYKGFTQFLSQLA